MAYLITNLLPPDEKLRMHRDETRRIIVFFAISTSIVFIIGTVMLLPSYIPFLVEERRLETERGIEEEASRAFRVEDAISEMHSVERLLGDIRTAGNGAQSASHILDGFLGASGSGIALSNIRVNEDGTFVLAGKADTRTDLLAFEGSLRETGQFQEITSPLSNIIRESNIQFTISGTFKPSYGLK